MQYWKRGAAALLLLALIAVLLPARSAAAETSFRVVGYYPYWEPGEVEKIQYDVLTHINYSFAIPTKEGGLLPLEQPDLARRILREGHQNGVKVLLAVGGWSYQNVPLASTFASATATAEKRAKLVQAIVAMCEEFGFDGVDMDWEYPRISDGTYRQYEALMLELSAALRSRGKLLTAAVPAGVSVSGTAYADSMGQTDAVLAAVDWINVMAYEGGDGQDHSPYSFAVYAARYWTEQRGLPGEKMVLGLPFYTRDRYVPYGDLLAAVPDAWNRDSAVYQGQTLWYNGIATIAAKTQYALKQQLGGVMIWEVSQDTAQKAYSLLSTIGRTVEQHRPFSDIPTGTWYEKEVYAAYEAGLMQGTGGGAFSPARTLTTAEGIALAARVHRIYTAGKDDLKVGTPWYQTYVNYALQHGILDRRPTASAYETVLTRGGFAQLLARSLPESALKAINTVERIPDVAFDHPQAGAIYRLFRAGVMVGTDAAGTFRPQNALTRAEAAALVLRMTQPERRVQLETQM